MSEVTQKRTGGRSAVVVASVRRAAEDLIAEKGRDHLTIPLIAERAGVNPTTIYRRWGDLGSMLNDIATYRLDPERPLPETGSLRTDLIEWAAEIVTHYSDPAKAAMLRGGIPAAGEQENNCLRNRRVEAATLLAAAGLEPGVDGVPSLDQIINHVVAPIVYRVIFLPWSLERDLAVTLVDELLSLPLD